MYQISDHQIDYMLHDIRERGITIESVRLNLLDHICIIIEENLEENGNFKEFYESAIKSFYRERLSEIQEETIFLLTFKAPVVILSRNFFFLCLFILFIGPFIGYDIAWYMESDLTQFYIPFEIWGATLVFSLFPLLILLVLFLTPDRLDPLIPWKSKIMIGIRPFIKIIPPDQYRIA